MNMKKRHIRWEKEKLEKLVKKLEWEGGTIVKKVILDRWGICISVDSNDERLCLMTKETDGGEERYHYYCYQLN